MLPCLLLGLILLPWKRALFPFEPTSVCLLEAPRDDLPSNAVTAVWVSVDVNSKIRVTLSLALSICQAVYKHLKCITSFNPYKNSKRSGLLPCPCHRWRECSSKRQNDLPKFSQSVMIWTWARFPECGSPTSHRLLFLMVSLPLLPALCNHLWERTWWILVGRGKASQTHWFSEKQLSAHWCSTNWPASSIRTSGWWVTQESPSEES